MAASGFDEAAHGGVAAALRLARQRLTTGQPMTLERLDDLRKLISDNVPFNQPAQARLGSMLKDNIDEFISSATPSNMAPQVIPGIGSQRPVNPREAASAIEAARQANMRFKKAENISDRLQSADLKTSGAYAGANIDNATRQALRPVVDPRARDRVRNFTPDEQAAATKVVKPGIVQDVLRWYGRTSPLVGGLQTTLTGAGILGPHGPGVAASGVASTASLLASNRLTRKNVQQLMNLIEAGGSQGQVMAQRQLRSLGMNTAESAAVLRELIEKGAAGAGAERQTGKKRAVTISVQNPDGTWTEPY
jgi:hypothetical protein